MNYDSKRNPKIESNGRHGAVGVIVESNQFLVIRRSRWVRAPGMWCFPGGGIEPGESIEAAVIREMQEELNIDVTVHRHLWSSRTAWGTDLEWLLLFRNGHATPEPNPREVDEIRWLTGEEILEIKPLLGSLIDFFGALRDGKFTLSSNASS